MQTLFLMHCSFLQSTVNVDQCAPRQLIVDTDVNRNDKKSCNVQKVYFPQTVLSSSTDCCPYAPKYKVSIEKKPPAHCDCMLTELNKGVGYTEGNKNSILPTRRPDKTRHFEQTTADQIFLKIS